MSTLVTCIIYNTYVRLTMYFSTLVFSRIIHVYVQTCYHFHVFYVYVISFNLCALNLYTFIVTENGVVAVFVDKC